MASLQHRAGSYRILFRHGGRQHAFTLGAVSSEEAEGKAAQVDYFLMRLKQGLVTLPPGTDIAEYLRLDGKVIPRDSPKAEKIALSTLRERYLETHSASLEPSTVACLRIHFRHLERVLGADFCVSELCLADLQRYVDARSKAKGVRKRRLSAATIQKELITLGTAFNWARKMKYLSGEFPSHGLRLPKTKEKQPFRTRSEIDRRIAVGGLADDEIADLWDSLYLSVDEISEFLQHMKANGTAPFVYPMATFAAHTGARRSEMIRLRIVDVDLDSKVAIIHEKKRVRGKTTTRRVPLSGFLITVLTEWLEEHPSGPLLFCQRTITSARRKPLASDKRKGSIPRTRESAEPLTLRDAHEHFQRSISKSKWEVVKGWHTLRHSFVSACASRCVDQRLVEAWAGHMTTEMSRRYSHLWPSVQQEALARVFG